MRLALISDIHGNLVALDSVLRELADESIDRVLCLGDVGSLGPQPHEVIGRLGNLRCPVALGNTDAWLLTPPAATEADPHEMHILFEINTWCAGQLSAEDRAYLRSLPARVELPLDEGRTLLGYHGSPRSFDDVIASVTSNETVKEMLAGYAAHVMVGGHTHVQMIRRYEGSHIVNVGSVGLAGVTAGSPELPMNSDVRWAEYGVLSLDSGKLSIDLRRTPLDMGTVINAAERSDMPHREWWLEKWARS